MRDGFHRPFIGRALMGPQESVAGPLLSGGNLHAVKKLILALVAAGAGVAMWRKRSSSKPQQQLWAQATDRV